MTSIDIEYNSSYLLIVSRVTFTKDAILYMDIGVLDSSQINELLGSDNLKKR